MPNWKIGRLKGRNPVLEQESKIINKALIYLQNRLNLQGNLGVYELDQAIYEYLESKNVSIEQFKQLDLEPDNLDP